MYILKRAYNKTVGELVAISIALECVSVYLLYLLNSTYGELYQGIQDYDKQVIWNSIGQFALIAMILVGVNGYLGYFLNKLSFAMRTALQNSLSASRLPDTVPNMPQRIQEDLKQYGEVVVEAYSAIFKAVLKLPIFVGVIVSLTEWWVGCAVVLATVGGTVATKLMGKKLVVLQAQQESNEAEYRNDLYNIYLMPPNMQAYKVITAQFYKINQQVKKLSFLQSGLGQMFVLLPFIILMPLYIAKTIPMGQFFQSVNALGKIIDSLTILIDNRQLLVKLESIQRRLAWIKGLK